MPWLQSMKNILSFSKSSKTPQTNLSEPKLAPPKELASPRSDKFSDVAANRGSDAASSTTATNNSIAMPHGPSHSERHSSHSDAIRDAIIGFADGLTVPFALTAGLSA